MENNWRNKMSKSNDNKTKLQEEIIPIKGMTCKNCVGKIESKLNSIEGVQSAKVSLMENKVFVKYNHDKVSLKGIKSEILATGYSVDGRKPEKKHKNILQGIAYGLIPHIGCIAFIIGAVLGVTVLMQFFRPLLMHRNFFYILILISLIFATLSSIIYLNKNGFMSWAGIKRKWKYLTTMYGSTIAINLVLFMVIFPLLANVSIANPTPTGGVIASDVDESSFSSIKLKVKIPCPGHAPLISQELKTIDGVAGIKYSFPNNFDVFYDPAKTSKQEMLSLEVFGEYPATVLEESAAVSQIAVTEAQAPAPAGTGGGCGCGGSSCGGAGGGASCCGG
ncbi:MAG: cation transporter [Nanoarchaeota archaeon]|nr:cation transporter [Nanoarchaeota archaeon]